MLHELLGMHVFCASDLLIDKLSVSSLQNIRCTFTAGINEKINLEKNLVLLVFGLCTLCDLFPYLTCSFNGLYDCWEARWDQLAPNIAKMYIF